MAISPTTEGPAYTYAATDPHQLAQKFLKRLFRDSHGHISLQFWRDEFWQFREGRYQRISQAELKAQISKFVHDVFQETKPTNKRGQILQVTRNVVSNVLEALMGKVLVSSDLEQPVWLGSGNQGPFFVFKNGMIPIEPLLAGHQTSVNPHCAQWFSQTSFPYEHERAAMCPRWLAFLDEVLEGDQERIRLLKQWFGYCLIPDTTQQRFVVAVGEGQNGKSVMFDLLTAMLGPENVSHVRVELFAQRFQLTMTLGKLANISYDTGKIDESAEATIKEFTGGDRMYFDRKGVPGVFAEPTARLILATNQDPRFADRSKGIWRRMIVIPFNFSVPQERQNPHLASELKQELPGIFNWAVEGLRDLRRVGHFVIPAVSQDAWQEARRESNPAREFLAERYQLGDPHDSVPCASAFGEYVSWCRDRGLKPLDMFSFGKEVRKEFPTVERRRQTSGQRSWVYCGVKSVSAVDPRSANAQNHHSDVSGEVAS